MEASAKQGAGVPTANVGIREIRHDFRAWLDRARAGERIIITDRGVPVAELGPHVVRRSRLVQMREQGLTIPATRSLVDLPEPIRIGGRVTSIVSDALRAEREDQRY